MVKFFCQFEVFFSHASSVTRRRAALVSLLAQLEISQQLWDGLLWDFVQTFMVPRGYILVIPWLFPQRHTRWTPVVSEWNIFFNSMKSATDIQGRSYTTSWLTCLVHNYRMIAIKIVQTFMLLWLQIRHYGESDQSNCPTVNLKYHWNQDHDTLPLTTYQASAFVSGLMFIR